MLTSPPIDSGAFRTAILCALPLEADAVLSVLDHVYSDSHAAPGDDNSYTCGVVGAQPVVVVHMPNIGTVTAASVTAKLNFSYPNIDLIIVAGVCGGIPGRTAEGREVFLGDLVVSTSVIQYDYGRRYPAGFERRTAVEDTLGRPNTRLRGLLNKLRTTLLREEWQNDLVTELTTLQAKAAHMCYPGSTKDVLFEPSYLHKHHNACSICVASTEVICPTALDTACDVLGCDRQAIVRERTHDAGSAPRQLRIHFGPIGSSNAVMKSGHDRDILAKDGGIIALEMEGAGVWANPTSCIIIKAVCDYADSHKNKEWQTFSAAVAASGTKAFLKHWRPEDKITNRVSTRATGRQYLGGNKHWMVPRPANPLFTGRDDTLRSILSILSEHLHEFPCSTPCRIVITGMSGIGKSEICLHIANKMRQDFWGVFWVDVSSKNRAEAAFIALSKQLGRPCSSVEQALLTLDNVAQPWLLVLDNADDVQQDYQIYFPTGSNGCTLISSRLVDKSRLAGTDYIGLDGLHDESGIDLLFKSANIDPDRRQDNRSDAYAICQMLGQHPLAIIQAGSYISSKHCSLSEYSSVFQRNLQSMLQFHPVQGLPRYRNVYATFEAAVMALKTSHAAERRDIENLLSTISMLGRTSLPLGIFKSAWKKSLHLSRGNTNKNDIRKLTHSHSKLTMYTYSSQSVHPGSRLSIDKKSSQTILKTVFSPKDKRGQEAPNVFNEKQLLQDVDLLASSALVTRGYQDGTSSIAMHTLVRYWAHARSSERDQANAWVRAAYLVACTREEEDLWQSSSALQSHVVGLLDYPPAFFFARHSPDMVARLLWQLLDTLESLGVRDTPVSLLEYIFRELQLEPSKPVSECWPLYSLYGSSLLRCGKAQEARRVFRTIVGDLEDAGSSNTSSRDLNEARFNLSLAYQTEGQPAKAVKLLEPMLESQPKSKSGDPSAVLKIQRALAGCYLDLGQRKRGTALLLHVVSFETAGPLDESTESLGSRFDLGKAYLDDRRIIEAIRLLEQVVAEQSRARVETDSELLDAQFHLARAFLENGQAAEALSLHQQVLKMKQKTTASSADSVLESQRELGGCHLAMGNTQQAFSLLEEVLQTWTRTKDSSDRFLQGLQIQTIDAYIAHDRVPSALRLLERYVNVLQQEHKDNDRQLLILQHKLGKAYRLDGQHKQGSRVLTHVVSVLAWEGGKPHHRLLDAQHELAKCHMARGHIAQAVELLEKVRRGQRKIMNEIDARRIDATFDLAKAYLESKRIFDAARMIEDVLLLQDINAIGDSAERRGLVVDISNALAARGQRGRATDMLGRCVTLRQRSTTSDSKKLVDMQQALLNYQQSLERSRDEFTDLLQNAVSLPSHRQGASDTNPAADDEEEEYSDYA